MLEHIMIDLETMGTSVGAPILSIGAARFDFNNEPIIDTFHVGVELESCMAVGLRPEAGTINWWLDPGRGDARHELNILDKVDLESALFGFRDWVGDTTMTVKVWGNSASFDLGILGHAFKLIREPAPWQFWNERCYRTMKSMFPVDMDRVGTHHKALDDAITQAYHLRQIMKSVQG